MFAIFDRQQGFLCFATRIADGFRGHWQDGVTLAPLPDDLYTLPCGPGWPDRIVGVSLDDHGLYRVFSYTDDVVGSGFRSTGLIYGGTFDRFPRRTQRKLGHHYLSGE